MTKIPVGATIAQAYRFAFEKFFDVLGIVWVPWAFLCAGNYLVIDRMSAALITAAAHPTAASHLGTIVWPLNLLTYTMMALQFIGVTKLAFGLPNASRYYYFSLDKSLLRLLAAFVLIFLLMMAALVVIILGAVALVFLINLLLPSPNSVATISKALVFVLAASAFVYFIIRLTFLVTPVNVAEQKVGLKRSWNLGRGNFWRMFAVFLSVMVPIMAVELIFIFGFLLHGMPPLPQLHATTGQVAANQANIAAWYAATIGQITRYWYVIYPIFLVVSGIFVGLLAGAQAFAYRALVQKEISEPVS